MGGGEERDLRVDLNFLQRPMKFQHEGGRAYSQQELKTGFRWQKFQWEKKNPTERTEKPERMPGSISSLWRQKIISTQERSPGRNLPAKGYLGTLSQLQKVYSRVLGIKLSLPASKDICLEQQFTSLTHHWIPDQSVRSEDVTWGPGWEVWGPMMNLILSEPQRPNC